MWIIEKDLSKIVDIYFVNDRMACCKIKQFNHHILIIGVHMECQSKVFVMQLDEIKNLIKGQPENCKIILLGDFNASNFRQINPINTKTNRITNNIKKAKYPNDINLTEFLMKQGFICLDQLFTQSTTFTYKLDKKHSWIDHIIIKDKDNWSNISQVNIVNNVLQS